MKIGVFWRREGCVAKFALLVHLWPPLLPTPPLFGLRTPQKKALNSRNFACAINIFHERILLQLDNM